MANLFVTFTRAALGNATFVPVEVGAAARSEVIEFDTVASEVGELAAAETEDIVSLYAETACWVAIGANPTAEAGQTGSGGGSVASRYLGEGERAQFAVAGGNKVAAIGVA